MLDDWFVISQVDEQTFAINEPQHVRSFLVVGSERAILFDTGMGVADIGAIARALTDRPILAVNSHHHFDHAGGNRFFDEIAIHESGAELLAEGPTPDWLASYWRGVADYLATFGLDPDAAPPSGDAMRRLPATFDADHPTYVPTVATQRLQDGQVIDLGDRRVLVMHTPGHSQDSICLIDTGHRLVFSADTVDSGVLYAHLPTSSVPDLARSVARLVPAVATGIDAVMGAHSRTMCNDPALVARLAADLRALEGGQVELEPTIDCFGQQAQQARFEDVLVVVPYAGDRPGLDGTAAQP